ELGARAGLARGAVCADDRLSAGLPCRKAKHRPGIAARARDYVPESARCVFEVTGSEPAEDGVSGVRGSRVENPAGGHQGLLRFAPGRIARPVVGKAARHSGGIEGKLRAAGAPGFDVPELLGARERQAGSAVTRNSNARFV